MSTLQEHCVDDVQEVRYVDIAGASILNSGDSVP
jgi:hypothetical protein